MNNSVQFNIIY